MTDLVGGIIIGVVGFGALIAKIVIACRHNKAFDEKLERESEEADRMFNQGDMLGACEYLAERSIRG